MYRPHSLPPSELYQAHLAPMLAPIQSELESRLRATQARNEQLAESIKEQRDEMEKLIVGLEAAVQDLDGANKVLDDAVDDDLRNEVKEVQAEVRGAAKL